MTLLLTLAQWLAWLLGAIALLATLLPLLRQRAWWVRIFDFPRLQIVAVLALGLLGALALPPLPGPWQGLWLWALGAAVLYQGYRVWPYTPLHRKQVADAARPAGDGAHHFSLLVSNVLMYNRDAARLLGHIRLRQPDVVLAVETDAWWLAQLQSVAQTHPHTYHAPLPNTYGMLVFSRLPLRQAEIRYLLEADVPSFHGQVVLPNGVPVTLHFLHPRPPAPGEAKSSVRRDAELLVVGREIAHHNGPTIVAGDLNDVAWSYTSELFRRLSRLLDPRIGRGLLPTFHANSRLWRWPLDHVFHSAHFRLQHLERLTYMGSDHFPIYIRLSYEPEGWHEQLAELETPNAEDRLEARVRIKEGMADAEEGAN
ncbi:endonuclease/exonuclease/phosphatase family protein [Hymenobacter caeli]|uniref:Endonuclease/exonuclease/phosphatase (EEP) superfamily protein YafD n=1 Tax=Hymenobacter caeli TaxID=2735894 RepID=A0ABX2FKW6_9BACT|nr:endonuclease/exonuclease/phosphatase family protein [Hymenobacter caeli]NRT17478.1 endonuclease/exonuclease/phosphatase (EEP) superfamily protein YafD [Hymenobacter caeli]